MQFLSQFGVVGVVVGVLLLFTPFFVLIWLGVRWVNKKRDAEYAEFCRRYNIPYDGSGFPIHATLDGRSFEIVTEMATSPMGRPRPNMPPLFTMRLSLKGSVPDGLFVGKRGLLDPATRRPTGDEPFDKKMYVDCPDDQVPAVQAYLTPERRTALVALASLKGLSCLGKARLVWQNQGFKPRADWLEARYQALAELAPTLDGDPPLV